MTDQRQGKDNFILGVMMIVIEVLTAKGVKQSSAVMIGKEIGESICERYGGCPYYISNRYATRAAETAADMYRDFDGRNYIKLAEKYNLSHRMVYSILSKTDKVKTVRSLKRRKRSGGSPTNAEALILLESRLKEDGDKHE